VRRAARKALLHLGFGSAVPFCGGRVCAEAQTKTVSDADRSLQSFHSHTGSGFVQHLVAIGANQGQVLEARLASWLTLLQRLVRPRFARVGAMAGQICGWPW
jgi:hypothetical protein